MVAKDKFAVEGGLAETKIILSWHFNFRTLTMTLLEHKHIAWSTKIQQIISMGRTLTKALESPKGEMGHVGFVIRWVYHFLSQLRTPLARARNRGFITRGNRWNVLTFDFWLSEYHTQDFLFLHILTIL
jgi:hypothetical protein